MDSFQNLMILPNIMFVIFSWTTWPPIGLSLECPYLSCSSQKPRTGCGPRSAEQRGRNTSLNLLAVLLMQPRIQLALFAIKTHYWLVFTLLSTRISSSFFCKATFQLSGSQNILVCGVVPPQGQNFALSFVELLNSFFDDFSIPFLSHYLLINPVPWSVVGLMVIFSLLYHS